MTAMISILASWADSRYAMALTPGALARRRARMWRRLQPALARTPAFRGFANRALDDFPVITPAQMRADHGRYNSLGLGDAQLRALAERSETGGPGTDAIAAGYSTGTSGTRGLFVTDAQERARYLGQTLARLLPAAALFKGARIALFLRANNALYNDVARGGWRFCHFPIDGDFLENARRLQGFSPQILIAPSHILARLARHKVALPHLRRCFYGAEPMGAAEREAIHASLGVGPDPIYQATEGFLGAACPLGQLHLNDHTLQIELAEVAGTTGFQPIVTDLCRTTQPIVRVLLDDFIELSGAPCPCGFAGRTILPVQGRVADLWRFGEQIVAPRQVSDAIERALGPHTAWQATARPSGVQITAETVQDASRVGEIVGRELQLPVPIAVTRGPTETAFPKRRRIRWIPNG